MILFCCTNVAKAFTDLALQEYKIDRQIAKNNRRQGVRHRHRQAMVPGQAITFAQLLNLVKEAQMEVADHRRFHRMQKVVATYNKQ